MFYIPAQVRLHANALGHRIEMFDRLTILVSNGKERILTSLNRPPFMWLTYFMFPGSATSTITAAAPAFSARPTESIHMPIESGRWAWECYR